MTVADYPLSVHDVSVRYRKHQVLTQCNLHVEEGSIVAIVGENGGGKSTLLRVCAGLQKPDEGTIHRVGRVGYCPQRTGLVERLTIDEHISWLASAHRENQAATVERTWTRLGELGMDRSDDKPAAALSGGQRQKLNLALALMSAPDILLLDEPYQGFDQGSYESMWSLLDGLRQDLRCIVVVTHLLAELHRVDRVVQLRHGRIES